jgi:Protein of unknown function (DUF1059)
MKRVLRCDCGFEARAEQDNELVAEVRRHASEAHGMALSPDEALLLAFRAELSQEPWTPLSTFEAEGSSGNDISDRKEGM